MNEQSRIKRDNTHPSCVTCQRRKVRCNRVHPCAACTKSGLECTFPEPTRRKPRSRKALATERRENAASAGAVVPIQPSEESQQRTSRSSSIAPRSVDGQHPDESPKPVLVSFDDGYLCLNNHLWRILPVREVRTTNGDTVVGSPTGSALWYSNTPAGKPAAVEQPTDDQETLFSSADGAFGSPFQPTVEQIGAIWEAFVNNVDPLMKVVHVPTIRPLVLGQIRRDSLPLHNHCLINAIYLISIVSMTEEEYSRAFNESRGALMLNLRITTEKALSRAGFVTTTDLTVFQAMLLYLSAILSLGEAEKFWAMAGMAARIGGIMGLKVDGARLGVSPFQAEIRRRVWWALVYLDYRTGESLGQEDAALMWYHDVKLPANIMDSDLSHSMREPPETRIGATDTCYVQLRGRIGLDVRTLIRSLGGGTVCWETVQDTSIPHSEKMARIDDMEQRLEEDLLRHCDPSIPLQRLTLHGGQIITRKLRLMAHLTPSKETFSHPIFTLSLEIMDIELSTWTKDSLRRFRWHMRAHFQWYALVCLIRQTRLHPPDSDTLHAWSVIRNVFAVIVPHLELGPKKCVLLDAVKSLLVSTSESPSAYEKPPTPPQTVHLQSTVSSRSQSWGGSAAHSALLPGMLSSPVPQSKPHQMHQGIDWMAFDRLIDQLDDSQTPVQ